MKIDRRLKILNAKNGGIYYVVRISILPLCWYLCFITFYEELSFKTGICQSCSGMLKAINNPLPGIVWVFLTAFIYQIFPKIFRNDFYDYYEKGKKIGEIKFDNGDIYYGQVYDTEENNEILANGRGFLTKLNGDIVKGVWEFGKLNSKE